MGPCLRRDLRILSFLAFGLLSHAAGAGCSKPDIERAAHRVRDVQHAMLMVPIADNSATDVPAEAQRQIAAMKASLGDFVDAYMRCVPPQADAKRLEHELLELARGSDPDPTDDDRYGGRIDFTVRVTTRPTQLVSVVATFSIRCGSDAVLLVFDHRVEAWSEALRWRSKDYPTVAGALWAFDYAISPADQVGGWFVVTKSVAPWCSSTWSEIRISVLRPSSPGVQPAELFTASYSMWWGGDDFGALSADTGGFTLRYHGMSRAPGELTAPYVRRFRIVGDRVLPVGQ